MLAVGVRWMPACRVDSPSLQAILQKSEPRQGRSLLPLLLNITLDSQDST